MTLWLCRKGTVYRARGYVPGDSLVCQDGEEPPREFFVLVGQRGEAVAETAPVDEPRRKGRAACRQ